MCVASVSSDDTCDAIGAATWPAGTTGAQEAVTGPAGTAGAERAANGPAGTAGSERAATRPVGTAGSEGVGTGPAGTAGAKGTATRLADTTDVYVQAAAVTVGLKTTGVTDAVVMGDTADLHTGSVSVVGDGSARAVFHRGRCSRSAQYLSGGSERPTCWCES